MSPRLGTGVSRKELLRTNTKSMAVARFLKFRALKDARPWGNTDWGDLSRLRHVEIVVGSDKPLSRSLFRDAHLNHFSG
jgi:hypothetical protein